MQKTLNPRQSGFTLIELIVVIVILGILAATALPKFNDLGTDARAASLNGAKGSLAATSAMAHGKYLISGGTTFTVEGTVVNYGTNANGYPKAEAAFATAAGLNTTDYAQTITGTTIKFVPIGISTNTTKAASCKVEYTEPDSTATVPTTVPTILVTTSSC